jgi:uncharacterized protein YbaP (TraB family)
MLNLLVVASVAVASAPAYAAQPQSQAAAEPGQQVADIIVNGQRTGIPFWRVEGGGKTIFLVGAISGVSREAEWNPEALTAALRRADRVMFPESRRLTIRNPFRLMSYMSRWKRHKRLPRGRSLAEMLQPEQLARLSALRARGIAPADYLTTHPLHLAEALRDSARAGTGRGVDVRAFVHDSIRRHRLTLVPVERGSARAVARDLFASAPEEHLPCLLSAIVLAEAGPEAIRVRSRAWAQRRVAEVLASPAEAVVANCWPDDPREEADHVAHMRATVRGLLSEPQITVAVLQLRTLAARGGVLDDLEQAGFEIYGPDWR